MSATFLGTRTPHLVIPADTHTVIPAKAPTRHSRESGNPEISMKNPCLSILARKPP